MTPAAVTEKPMRKLAFVLAVVRPAPPVFKLTIPRWIKEKD